MVSPGTSKSHIFMQRAMINWIQFKKLSKRCSGVSQIISRPVLNYGRHMYLTKCRGPRLDEVCVQKFIMFYVDVRALAEVGKADRLL